MNQFNLEAMQEPAEHRVSVPRALLYVPLDVGGGDAFHPGRSVADVALGPLHIE